ncbi:S8/S53 family peptidase [Mycolicibacter heraklionensis]|nr:S8/S53 family peptidase [Mycolicibacter heraklionensis]
MNAGAAKSNSADTLAAKAAHLWTLRMGRRIGALCPLDDNAADPVLFVENELLVGSEHGDVVDELIHGFGGRIAPPKEIPKPPRHLTHRARDITLPPPTLRIVFGQSVSAAMKDNDFREQSGVSSEVAASMAALIDRYPEGLVGLNYVSRPCWMPLSSIVELNGMSPIGSGVFDGAAHFIEAWQLIDSYRMAKKPQDVMLAVLDNGFWIPNLGSPTASPGSASGPDLRNPLVGLNVDDPKLGIGGPSSDPLRRWHGAAVASAAAGVINNMTGSVGAGSQVAFPVLLLRSESLAGDLFGLQLCAVWGVDVLNMSFRYGYSFGSPGKEWDKASQFAAQSGVAMVAAAGNDGQTLVKGSAFGPKTYPAADPHVIAVGALAGDNLTAWPKSSRGPMVDIWAPGTDVPVAPDGDNPAVSARTGTSMASPLVAGTIAMMRAVAPTMDIAEIKKLLLESARDGAGPVTKGLDAYAAVLSALDYSLPDWTDSPSPRPLYRFGSFGAYRPLNDGFGIAKEPGDVDDYALTLTEYSWLTAEVSWYERLADVTVTVLNADGETVAGLKKVPTAPGVRRRDAIVPPGTYTVRVTSTGLTAYHLNVNPMPWSPAPDRFEPNDTFDTATWLRFRRTPLDSIAGNGPGTFELTLHEEFRRSDTVPWEQKRWMDRDYFVFDAPARQGRVLPWIGLTSEVPVDLTLFNEDRAVIRQWSDKKELQIRPPESARSYLKVSGSEPTRYSLTVSMLAEFRVGDLPTFEVLPEWWTDPAHIQFVNHEVQYSVELTGDRLVNGVPAGEPIVFDVDESSYVEAELVTSDGAVVQRAAVHDNVLTIDTGGLEPGSFTLRLTNPTPTEPATLRLVPPYRSGLD